jgi:AbrB family looped-hinge helix DNA binding protein
LLVDLAHHHRLNGRQQRRASDWPFVMVELESRLWMSYICYIDKGKVRKMPETATLSSKFQISIPKAIRSAQHWEAGLMFAFIPKGKGVLLVPVPQRDALKGIAKGAQASDYRDRADRF